MMYISIVKLLQRQRQRQTARKIILIVDLLGIFYNQRKGTKTEIIIDRAVSLTTMCANLPLPGLC